MPEQTALIAAAFFAGLSTWKTESGLRANIVRFNLNH